MIILTKWKSLRVAIKIKLRFLIRNLKMIPLNVLATISHNKHCQTESNRSYCDFFQLLPGLHRSSSAELFISFSLFSKIWYVIRKQKVLVFHRFYSIPLNIIWGINTEKDSISMQYLPPSSETGKFRNFIEVKFQALMLIWSRN